MVEKKNTSIFFPNILVFISINIYKTILKKIKIKINKTLTYCSPKSMSSDSIYKWEMS